MGCQHLVCRLGFLVSKSTSLTTSPRTCLIENKTWDCRVQPSVLQKILGLDMTRWQVSTQQSQLCHLFPPLLVAWSTLLSPHQFTVPSSPEQASTSNAPMMSSPPHVPEMTLPHFVDCWFDGTNEWVSIQVHLSTGLPVAVWVEEDERTFVC